MTTFFKRIFTIAILAVSSHQIAKAQNETISLNGSVFGPSELGSYGNIEFVISCSNPGYTGTFLDPNTVFVTISVPTEVMLGTATITQETNNFPPTPPIVSGAWTFNPDGSPNGSGWFENILPLEMGNPVGQYTFTIPYTVTSTITAPAGGANNYFVRVQRPGLPNNSSFTVIEGVVTATMASLPVTFNHFKAAASSCKVQLDWNVAKELGAEQYLVERSADGKRFETIGQLTYYADAKGAYHFVDEDPLKGNNLYRIAGVDPDGTKVLTGVQRISIDCDIPNISIFPNPTSSGIKLSGLKAGQRIMIYDLTGRILISTRSNGAEAQLDLSNFAAAVYKVVVTSAEGIVIYSNKISKQ